MSDYFDRVERQLVQRADALYSPTAVGSLSVGQRVRGYKLSRGRSAGSDASSLIREGPGAWRGSVWAGSAGLSPH
jgi:hypothetical protein